VKYFTWVPGVKSANTPINLPEGATKFCDIQLAYIGETALTVIAKEDIDPVSGLGTGEISLLDSAQIQLGNALLATNRVHLYGNGLGERQRVE